MSPLILNDGTNKLYIKPNNEIKYIHKNSNHPPNVIRRIPLSIESKLSILSFNKKIYQEAVPPYQNLLQILSIDTDSHINVLK